MHGAAHKFVEKLVGMYPQFFKGVNAIEFGSRYVNGSARDCFYQSKFLGIDPFPGENVDVVSLAHEYVTDKKYNVAFTTEMLEHDPHWKESLRVMIDCVRPGGLFFLTCATTGRKEHGTERQGESELYTPDPSYYRNLTAQDVTGAIRPEWFVKWGTEINPRSHDLYAWGIRA